MPAGIGTEGRRDVRPSGRGSSGFGVLRHRRTEGSRGARAGALEGVGPQVPKDQRDRGAHGPRNRRTAESRCAGPVEHGNRGTWERRIRGPSVRRALRFARPVVLRNRRTPGQGCAGPVGRWSPGTRDRQDRGTGEPRGNGTEGRRSGSAEGQRGINGVGMGAGSADRGGGRRVLPVARDGASQEGKAAGRRPAARVGQRDGLPARN